MYYNINAMMIDQIMIQFQIFCSIFRLTHTHNLALNNNINNSKL